MTSKRDELIEFAHICGQENIPRNLVAKCLRFAKRATWYAVQDCNVGLTDYQRAARERAADRVNKELKTIGARVQFHGDPRGCVAKLIVKSGRTNDFAQEGICIPA